MYSGKKTLMWWRASMSVKLAAHQFDSCTALWKFAFPFNRSAKGHYLSRDCPIAKKGPAVRRVSFGGHKHATSVEKGVSPALAFVCEPAL